MSHSGDLLRYFIGQDEEIDAEADIGRETREGVREPPGHGLLQNESFEGFQAIRGHDMDFGEEEVAPAFFSRCTANCRRRQLIVPDTSSLNKYQCTATAKAEKQ